MERDICTTCSGSGESRTGLCPTCHGTGEFDTWSIDREMDRGESDRYDRETEERDEFPCR